MKRIRVDCNCAENVQNYEGLSRNLRIYNIGSHKICLIASLTLILDMWTCKNQNFLMRPTPATDLITVSWEGSDVFSDHFTDRQGEIYWPKIIVFLFSVRQVNFFHYQGVLFSTLAFGHSIHSFIHSKFLPKLKHNHFKMPNLSYRSGLNGQSQDDCRPCDRGKYCPGTNNTRSVEDCDPGYYCGLGNHMATPNNSTDSGLCPLGKYCPVGTITPENCPNGTVIFILV